MFRKPTIIFIIVSMLVLPCMAGAVEVAPRISDREIVESLAEIKQRQQGFSEKLDQFRSSLNQRMDDMMANIDKRFESSNNTTRTMFGSTIALIIALIGYMIWDRRAAVKPLQTKIMAMEETTQRMGSELDMNHPSGSLLERLVAAFRELAKTDEKVADVLRSFSLL